METALNNNHLKWKDVKFLEEEYEVTDNNRNKGDLIYLSSDSDYTLKELEEGKTYIIGGIVDRNRHKVCFLTSVLLRLFKAADKYGESRVFATGKPPNKALKLQSYL